MELFGTPWNSLQLLGSREFQEVPRKWEKFQGIGMSSKELAEVPRSQERFQGVGRSSK